VWRHHLSNLLSRAWQNLVSALSSSNLSHPIFSFAIPISVFLVLFIYKWVQARKAGRNAKDVLRETAAPTFIAGAITAFAWICLFGWSVGATIYQDHQALVAKLKSVSQTPVVESDPNVKHIQAVRSGLAELIRRGVAIRNRAFQNQMDPAVISSWQKWRGEVEHFLAQNLDSADVETFKSLNIESYPLTEKVMFEITDLEQIVNRQQGPKTMRQLIIPPGKSPEQPTRDRHAALATQLRPGRSEIDTRGPQAYVSAQGWSCNRKFQFQLSQGKKHSHADG
jgi:hypothetical protein